MRLPPPELSEKAWGRVWPQAIISTTVPSGHQCGVSLRPCRSAICHPGMFFKETAGFISDSLGALGEPRTTFSDFLKRHSHTFSYFFIHFHTFAHFFSYFVRLFHTFSDFFRHFQTFSDFFS